jgi:5-methylcytosine-specific restriction endonuclease McrA
MKIDRQEVHDKFQWHCAYCGCDILLKEMQVEHIIPKSNFEMRVSNNINVPSFLTHLRVWNENHIDNLFPSCRSCNYYKETKSLDTFRKELEKQRERLQDNFNYKMAKKYWQIQETPIDIIFYFERYITK